MTIVELLKKFQKTQSSCHIVITKDSDHMPVARIYAARVVIQLDENRAEIIKNKLTEHEGMIETGW